MDAVKAALVISLGVLIPSIYGKFAMYIEMAISSLKCNLLYYMHGLRMSCDCKQRNKGDACLLVSDKNVRDNNESVCLSTYIMPMNFLLPDYDVLVNVHTYNCYNSMYMYMYVSSAVAR